MYSAGSDSTESQNYTQWALNPSSYQNMSNEQVDWAALAQQWIIMKEAAVEVPPHQKQQQQQQAPVKPPPAPIISKPAPEPAKEEAKGKEESARPWKDSAWNHSAQQQAQQGSWGWNSSWQSPGVASPPANASAKGALLPTPGFNSYSSSKEAPSENSSFNYNSGSNQNQGYWSSSGNATKVIKPHNKRYSKVNVPVPVPVKSTPLASSPTVTLDAAKRKQLPAWIREGLEKMERDKLKHVDKDKEKNELDEIEDKMKLRENALEILKNTVKQTEVKKLSVYDDDDSEDETPPSPPRLTPIVLTHEEMMLKVRRTMTEILLKVTNREIQNICREELQRHVRKMKASDQRVSAPGGANLSANLGLGAYGSDDSGSDSDDNNQGYQDSDSELRDIIRRRKEEFAKTEREIEERLAQAESRKEVSRASTPDSDSQVEPKVQEHKSRREDDGTPPLKVNCHHHSKSDRKHQSSSSSGSDSDRNSKSRRDHSRSRSSSSDRYRKSRRSRSRSPRPYKKHKPIRRSRSVTPRRRDSRRSSRYSRSRSRSRSYRRRSDRSRSRNRSDSRSTYRSRSRSRSARRYRRSRSHSSGRGKRSHRH